ncbi:MAG TPA: DUF2058 family protein [Steroidobacteraceae bacterium]
MSMSLREQLLQAGLITEEQAKQAEAQERQRWRQRTDNRDKRGPTGQQHRREQSARAQRDREERRKQQEAAEAKARAEKAAREAERQQRHQEQQERKARWLAIKQLIEQHRLEKLDTDERFNFIDRGKVRRISVDAGRRAKLVSGELMIVRCEGRYDVVPADVAARIAELDSRAVVNLAPAGEPPGSEDDPYKDFVVPDDLMW